MSIQGSLHGLRSRGGYNVDIRLEGDWFKLKDLTNNQQKWLRKGARVGQRKFALKYLKEIKKNIRNGGKELGYLPLSPAYKALKVREGGGTIALRWSKSMLNAVKMKDNKTADMILVGIAKGLSRPKYHKSDNNKLQVHEYANVMEQSYPRRPVFTDSWKRIKGNRGLTKAMIDHIQQSYLIRGYKINKT